MVGLGGMQIEGERKSGSGDRRSPESEGAHEIEGGCVSDRIP